VTLFLLQFSSRFLFCFLLLFCQGLAPSTLFFLLVLSLLLFSLRLRSLGLKATLFHKHPLPFPLALILLNGVFCGFFFFLPVALNSINSKRKKDNEHKKPYKNEYEIAPSRTEQGMPELTYRGHEQGLFTLGYWSPNG
jgi:hypothetical protein